MYIQTRIHSYIHTFRPATTPTPVCTGTGSSRPWPGRGSRFASMAISLDQPSSHPALLPSSYVVKVRFYRMMRHGRLSPRDRVVLANEEAPIWAAYRMPVDRQVRNDGLIPSIRTGPMQSEAPFGLRSCFRRPVRTPILSPSSVRAPPATVPSVFLDTPFLKEVGLSRPVSFKSLFKGRNVSIATCMLDASFLLLPFSCSMLLHLRGSLWVRPCVASTWLLRSEPRVSPGWRHAPDDA